MNPTCQRTPRGTACEYTVVSFNSSRDSDPEYLVDLSPDNFGCSCKHDDYVCRPKRNRDGTNTNTICKHIQLAMQQFYLDNVINKGKK